MTRAEIESQLRRVKPASIQLVVDDEAPRPVALRTGRTRWEHAAGLLVQQISRGARAELLDADGALLAVIEDERRQSGEAADKRVPVADALLAQMLQAQDHAVDRVIALVRTTMDAQVNALRALSERVSAVEKEHTKILASLYRVTVESAAAVRDATLAVAEAEMQASGGTEGKLLDMAEPLIRRAVGAPKAPPNGSADG